MALFDRFRRRKTAQPTPESTVEQERLAHEAAERERQAREEAERQAELLAREQAERADHERAERAEQEREALERAERRQQERVEQEQAERAERERAEREQAERAERERAEREQAERAEQERRDQEQAERERTVQLEPAEPDPDDVADEDPAVAAERAKVRRMVDEVGPELRQRRIIDLLGATFGRLAPPGEWGSTTIEFRPAPGQVFLRVSVAGPDGGRSGGGSWNPAASMVEMLIQELQHSMYVPGSGTWIDGRITFTHRGAREDKRGRALPPEADVAVNWSKPPTVGVDEYPYTADEAQAFLARYPRDEVPEFLRELTTQAPPKRRRWF